MRISWDKYFMNIAKSVAVMATCKRLSVGCVIVKDNIILSTGYNCSPKGIPHCIDIGCLLNPQGRCVRTVHAEQNAIIHSKESLEGCTIYVTHSPCESCMNLIIQSGISEIVYDKTYENDIVDDIIKNSNIKIRPIA